MISMKVLYFNNCWFTNVGEAFIDIGGMKLTQTLFGEGCQLACISAMTDYYVKNAPSAKHGFFSRKQASRSLNFKMSDHLLADYVVIPGMVGTIEYLNAPSCAMVDTLINNGCRPIFLGLGGEKYNQEETDALKRYFDRVKPALITTRDDEVYEFYKDVAPCVKAIDCAFWSVDSFDPRGFENRNYEVVAFNRTAEPEELKMRMDVVRPWHMQYIFRKEYGNETIFISDTPYDYLTLYANASKVYTDLVHATIVSLMYGTPVKFWKNGERYRAFYAIKNLKDEEGFLSVPEQSLIKQKEQLVQEMKKTLLREE